MGSNQHPPTPPLAKSASLGNSPSRTPQPSSRPEVPLHVFIQRQLHGVSPLATRMNLRNSVPYEMLAIPPKHRRTISDNFVLEKKQIRRKKRGGRVSVSPGRVRSTPLRTVEEEGVKTARAGEKRLGWQLGEKLTSTARKLTVNTSPPSPPFHRSDTILSLHHTCSHAHFTLRKELRIVRRKQRLFLTNLRRCSVAVNHALRLDIDGYLPKDFVEYKKKKAEERVARGFVPLVQEPVNIRKEVVDEYRKEMMRKALQRGIDKEMRYIYTFGSCSAAGT